MLFLNRSILNNECNEKESLILLIASCSAKEDKS